QENHANLVKTIGKDVTAQTSLDAIGEFVHKGLETGKVLDACTEREAAQSLITFWIARLASAKRLSSKESNVPLKIPEYEDTLLEEFSPDELVRAVIQPT